MKHKFKTWLAVALLLALSGGVATFAEEDPYREKKQRTSWLADLDFGTMHHFLIYPPGKTEQEKSEGMNRIVDGFDVQAFMNDFDRSGADWLIFTIGQNSSYYCAPNSVLDERLPGHTSRRDLIQEIGSEVKKRNKRFNLYLPAETRHNTPEMELIRRAFGWKPGDQSEFRTRYTAFIREYSERYGTMVDGWWFDGSQVDRSVFGDFSEWLAACRAGNPGAIVAFNPGPALKEFGEHEDYMAGEIFELPPPFMPTSQYLRYGVQYHALLPINSRFVGNHAHCYTDEELFDWYFKIRAVRGAVTFAVHYSGSGKGNEESIQQCRRLRDLLEQKKTTAGEK